MTLISALFAPNTDDLKDAVNIIMFIVTVTIYFVQLLVSLYSIYREEFVINSNYLKRIRSLMIVLTLLSIAFFVSLWINFGIIFVITQILWIPLETYTIISMTQKFGESYIILMTDKYSLLKKTKIPRIYEVLLWLLLFIAICINTIATIVTYTYSRQNSILFFGIWLIIKSVFLTFILFMLKTIKNRFKHLSIKNQSLSRQNESNPMRHSNDTDDMKHPSISDSNQAKSSNKQIFNKKRKRKVNAAQSEMIPEYYQNAGKYDESRMVYSLNIDSSSHEINATLDTHSHNQWTITIKDDLENNDNDYYKINMNEMLNGEIRRMRILMIALSGGISFCAMCGVYYLLGHFQIPPGINFGFELISYTLTVLNAAATNAFLIWFSWIPKHQIRD